MKKWMTFESFGFAEVQHAFSLRRSVSLDQIDFDLSDSLSELAISPQQTVQGEQTHGNEVAVVNAPSVSRIPRVDALITATPRLALVVRVADCGPLFLRSSKKNHRRGAFGTQGNRIKYCAGDDFKIKRTRFLSCGFNRAVGTVYSSSSLRSRLC